MRQTIMLFLNVLLCCSLALAQATGGSSKKLTDDDAIRLTVFRALVVEYYRPDIRGNEPTFFAVEEKDPGPELIKSLNIGARVKSQPTSECEIDGDGVPRDRATHREGVLFNVGKIKWLKGEEATLDGWFQIGNLGGTACTYVLKRQAGSWSIKDTVQCSIS